MLLKPKRRLPARFNRPVSRSMRLFAARRHGAPRRGIRTKARTKMRRLGGKFPKWWAVVRQWWLPVVGGFVAMLLGIVVFSPLFQVRRITVQRNQGRVDVALIQQQIAPLLGHRLLLLSVRDIEALVKQVVPDLQEITIRKEYPSKLVVRIAVRPIIARLHLSAPVGAVPQGAGILPAEKTPTPLAPNLRTPKSDYLTDNGLYVTAAVAESGALLPMINVVDWEVRPSPGTRLISEEFLNTMGQAEALLSQQFGQKVTGRSVYLRAQEFHLSITQGSLWFDVQSPLPEQLRRYRIFLGNGGWSQASQYVDLRLRGRVVYR